MRNPRIKEFYQVYQLPGDSTIFIGVGPEKIAIDHATDEMAQFLGQLDGTLSMQQLISKYPQASEWIEALDQVGVIEETYMAPIVNDNTLEQFSRQVNYFKLYERENGMDSWEIQQKLSAARVVVVGTGAGGTTLLRLLNAVGVGQLEAVDFDRFEVSNLPTHITLDEDDIGLYKIDVLERHLKKQNSKVKFIGHKRKIKSAADLATLIQGADFLCSTFDRPRVQAEEWSNEASLIAQVPQGSIGATDKGARVGPIVIPRKTACTACVGIAKQRFIKQSERGALMGTTVSLLASIMVHDIVKVITGYASPRLVGRSLYINTDELTFTFTDHTIKENCICQTYHS